MGHEAVGVKGRTSSADRGVLDLFAARALNLCLHAECHAQTARTRRPSQALLDCQRAKRTECRSPLGTRSPHQLGAEHAAISADGDGKHCLTAQWPRFANCSAQRTDERTAARQTALHVVRRQSIFEPLLGVGLRLVVSFANAGRLVARLTEEEVTVQT